MSIESVMPSNHLILCHPLLLLPSIFPRIRVFSNESLLCIRWPKYESFSFSGSPSNEYPWLIYFRIDQFDLTIQRKDIFPTSELQNSEIINLFILLKVTNFVVICYSSRRNLIYKHSSKYFIGIISFSFLVYLIFNLYWSGND